MAVTFSQAQRVRQHRLYKFDPNQPRDKDGKWTTGGAAAAGLAGLALLGGAGAAFRYGPNVARYLAGLAKPKPSKPKGGLMDALRADARRAKDPKVYAAGARSVGRTVGGVPKAVRRDLSRTANVAPKHMQEDLKRLRAAIERAKQRRRGRFFDRGYNRKRAALSFALLKGYPEYNDDQVRGEDGQWTAGGGSGTAGRGAGSHLTVSIAGLSSVSTTAQARESFKDSVDVYNQIRRAPEDSSIWRDPTWLDKAWGAYKSTTLAALGITALAGVAAGAGVAGTIIGGAHLHPIHSGIGAGLMAVAPSTTTYVTYQAAIRYLSLLFPKEAKAVLTAAKFAPLIAGGIAALGAALATALTLRYAYRKYRTNGNYQGVSSINRRLFELDGHIGDINRKMTTLKAMQKDWPK